MLDIIRSQIRSSQTLSRASLLPLVLLCATAGARHGLAGDAFLQYGTPVELSRLENKKISESSGLAASRRHPGYYWTHNDSGGKPRLFCFDRQGKHIGTCQLKKAGNVDWEDMCSFTIDGKHKLLIGDVGDNQARRRSCRLYLLDEPDDPSDEVKDYHIIKLRYSTGPLDCEAIGVDSVSRKLICVEKRWGLSCRVLEAPYPGEELDQIVAKPIGRLSLPLVTAMDISPDGRRALVLTMGQAYEFTRGPKETWRQAFAGRSRKIDMPARRQGETVCYDTDGRNIFLTSEMPGSGRTPFYGVFAKNK